jgi:hypothetical protein
LHLGTFEQPGKQGFFRKLLTGCAKTKANLSVGFSFFCYDLETLAGFSGLSGDRLGAYPLPQGNFHLSVCSNILLFAAINTLSSILL